MNATNNFIYMHSYFGGKNTFREFALKVRMLSGSSVTSHNAMVFSWFISISLLQQVIIIWWNHSLGKNHFKKKSYSSPVSFGFQLQLVVLHMSTWERTPLWVFPSRVCLFNTTIIKVSHTWISIAGWQVPDTVFSFPLSVLYVNNVWASSVCSLVAPPTCHLWPSRECP